ncbi:MAG: nucleotidyltransferase family protein [Pseudomonadota bacterium]
MRLAAILLAAGRSQRFGTEDKLLATYKGRPLVSHAADAIRALRPTSMIAVLSSEAVATLLPDFQRSCPKPGLPQSASLIAGVKAALSARADKALIVLGDMPNVTPALLKELVKRADDDHATAATDGQTSQPPVCFPRGMLGKLLDSSGDQGARELITMLPTSQLVHTSVQELKDVDEQIDLT